MNKLHVFFFTLIISCTNYVPNNHANVLKYNESASITSLDPIFSNTQSNIWVTSQIFNTLIELDETMNIRPSIATKWIISPDGLKYTFVIRDDVYYHNSKCFGKDSTRLLVASDFIKSISRINNKENLSPGSWVMDYLDIDNIYAINDTLLEFNLSHPFPGMLGMLTMSYFSFVPHEAIEYYGNNFSNHPIGTGPFIFKAWHKNEKLILLKNDNYFEYENEYRLPYLDAISISFITQKESVFMNFMLGNFDFVSGLDHSFKDEFIDHNGFVLDHYKNKFTILSTPFLNIEYLGINLPKAIVEDSPLMYKKFRKALNYSFDRNKMVQYLRHGLVTPGEHGFVPPSLTDCYNITGYHYAPDSVIALLSEVPNFNQTITLNTTQDYLDICEYIRFSASDFGIDIDIEISAPSVHRELFSSGQASLFRASWIADYPDPENFLSLFYSINKSPEGPNYTHFENDLFDSLYRYSFSSNNVLDRCQLFNQMEKIILDEAIFVPLYYDYAVRLVSNNIEGMSINAMNSLSLKKVKKF